MYAGIAASLGVAIDGETTWGLTTQYESIRIHSDGSNWWILSDFIDSLTYAEIYGADTSTTITIASSGKANKVQITSFAVDGVSNNATPDYTNDHITITKAGMYLCTVSMHINSVAGGTAEVYGYSVYKNNGATEFANLHGQRNMAGSGGDEGSVPLSGIIDLAANDTIELWIWNKTNTDNVEVDDINLSLVQVGST